jgi:hypothetical protein
MPAPKLEKIPGLSRGVRVNSAQRMVKLNRPICPNSRTEYDIDRTGKVIPKPNPPDRMNCQEEGGEWWVRCEERGHNPYFSTRKWHTTQDKLEETELPDGTKAFVKTGEYLIPHEEKVPNIAQVAVNLRINSGEGAKRAVRMKGFRRLKDAGYEEVCQFRNCQKEVTKRGTSRKYGAYCSIEHLQLIAADQESIMLTQGAALPVDSQRAEQKRQKQLREIVVGEVDQ